MLTNQLSFLLLFLGYRLHCWNLHPLLHQSSNLMRAGRIRWAKIIDAILKIIRPNLEVVRNNLEDRGDRHQFQHSCCDHLSGFACSNHFPRPWRGQIIICCDQSNDDDGDDVSDSKLIIIIIHIIISVIKFGKLIHFVNQWWLSACWRINQTIIRGK